MIIDWFSRTFLGKNTKYTSVSTIVSQLNEPRPLPTGVTEWKAFSERILSGSLFQADKESYEYVLANMILTLGPTESHKPDAYFIHGLKKVAANQIADARRKELWEAKKKRDETDKLAKQAEEANKPAEATLERAEALKAKGLTLVPQAAILDDSKV